MNCSNKSTTKKLKKVQITVCVFFLCVFFVVVVVVFVLFCFFHKEHSTATMYLAFIDSPSFSLSVSDIRGFKKFKCLHHEISHCLTPFNSRLHFILWNSCHIIFTHEDGADVWQQFKHISLSVSYQTWDVEKCKWRSVGFCDVKDSHEEWNLSRLI